MFGTDEIERHVDLPTMDNMPLHGIEHVIILPMQARKISSILPVKVDKATLAGTDKGDLSVWVGLPAAEGPYRYIPVDLSIALVAYDTTGLLQAEQLQSRLLQCNVVPGVRDASWTWDLDPVEVRRGFPVPPCMRLPCPHQLLHEKAMQLDADGKSLPPYAPQRQARLWWRTVELCMNACPASRSIAREFLVLPGKQLLPITPHSIAVAMSHPDRDGQDHPCRTRLLAIWSTH
jgi:hypothetical protein